MEKKEVLTVVASAILLLSLISIIYNQNITGNVALDITTCTNIDQAGVYNLKNDVTSNSTCFNINVDDVFLDCESNTITYGQASSGFGINASNINNLTITNCNIVKGDGGEGDNHAILMEKVNTSSIDSNTISTNGGSDSNIGIKLVSGHKNNISENTITTNGLATSNYGIELHSGLGEVGNHTVSDNSITTNGTNFNFGILGGFGNSIISNTINSGGTGNWNYGISLGSSHFVSSNTITSSGANDSYGINIGGNLNNIDSNDITTEGSGVRNYGIGLFSPSNQNTIQSNSIQTSNEGTENHGIVSINTGTNTYKNNLARVSSSDSYEWHSKVTDTLNTNMNLDSNTNISSFGISIIDSLSSTEGNALGTPTNLTSAGIFVNITNNTANHWAILNISYESLSLGEQTLGVWEYNGSDWNNQSAITSIDSQNEVLSSNISSGLFGVFGSPKEDEDDNETDDDDDEPDEITTSYKITENQFSSGVTRRLGVGDSIELTFEGSDHVVKLEEISGSVAIISVASDPTNYTLSVGDVKNIDLDNDNTLDLSITFIDVDNDEANILVKKIEQVNETPKDQTPTPTQTTPREEEGIQTSTLTIIIIVAIVIVAFLVGMAIIFFRKNLEGGTPMGRFHSLLEKGNKSADKKDFNTANRIYSELYSIYGKLSLKDKESVRMSLVSLHARLPKY